MDEVTLSLAEVRQWASRTLNVLEAWGHKEISVPLGLYHFMDPTELWTMPAVKPVVGDSRDDISTLREEVLRPMEDLVDWHSLQHLIGILSVVASQITPQLGKSA
jgi:hypothetical protein